MAPYRENSGELERRLPAFSSESSSRLSGPLRVEHFSLVLHLNSGFSLFQNTGGFVSISSAVPGLVFCLHQPLLYELTSLVFFLFFSSFDPPPTHEILPCLRFRRSG